MLKNDRGHWVQHHELYPLLGIQGTVLPDAGFYKTVRRGHRLIEYTCTPLGVTSASTARGGHRLKFKCDCGRWIPFGRAGQHLAKCEPYQRAERAFNLDESALGGYSYTFAEASNAIRKPYRS